MAEDGGPRWSEHARDNMHLAMRLIPEFEGIGDVSEWLARVDAACALNGIQDDKDVVYAIILRLKGGAYEVVRQMDPTFRGSRKEVQAVLLQTYKPNVHDQPEPDEPRWSGRAKQNVQMILRLVPEFSGEGDVVEWLHKVDAVCHLNDIQKDDDVMCVITLRLRGEAYRVVQRMDPAHRYSREKVQTVLQTTYGAKLHDTCNVSPAKQQKGGNWIDGYLFAMEKLAGLQGKIDDVYYAARCLTGLKKQRRMDCDQLGALKCYRCRKTGHLGRNCPTLTCYMCGMEGHMARACTKTLVHKD